MERNTTGGDVLADLQAAIERLEQQARNPIAARDDEGMRQLAEAFAARHGFEPPPSRAPEQLEPLLRFAIDAGVMSADQARDVDAFADGILARGRAGEITEEQADELIRRQAVRDALAFRTSTSNRAARRAEAAARRKAQK